MYLAAWRSQPQLLLGSVLDRRKARHALDGNTVRLLDLVLALQLKQNTSTRADGIGFRAQEIS